MTLTLTILAAHMAGEFIFQTDWMAARKLLDWRPRLAHVATYTVCFVPVVIQSHLPLEQAIAFLVAVGVPHFVVDCRRWASADTWPPKPIMVDQAVHVVCLAIASAAFKL